VGSECGGQCQAHVCVCVWGGGCGAVTSFLCLSASVSK